MGAAFNWSPGGCCCKENAPWDLYCVNRNNDRLGDSRFVRYSTIGAGHSGINDPRWFIAAKPPRVGVSPTQLTIVPDEAPELVWAAEQPLVVYDPIGKEELDVISYPLPSELTSFGTTPYGSSQEFSAWQTAVSQSELATIRFGGAQTQPFGQQAATLALARRNQAAMEYYKLMLVQDGTAPRHTVQAVSVRSWPIVAGVTHPQADPSSGSPITFFYGNATFDPNFTLAHPTHPIAGKLYVPGRTNVKTVTAPVGLNRTITRPQWTMFDAAPDGWMGVIAYGVQLSFNSTEMHIELHINGQMALNTVFLVSGTSPAVRSQAMARYNWIHISPPSETGGSRVYAVVQRDNTGDPRGWRIIAYNSGGTELWRSNPTAACTIPTSSDRWLYARGLFQNNEMPNQVRQFQSFDSQCLNFLIRPDGSQSYPSGELPDRNSPVQASFLQTHIDFLPLRHDVVRDAGAIPYTIPADANEFPDALGLP